MIANFLRTTARSLQKNKVFTILNITGLSIGLASCLLIVLYVVDEMSYDKYNVNAERIFRITEIAKLNGHEASYAGSEKPLMDAFPDFPEIEKSTRIIPSNILFLSPQKFFIRKKTENIQEKRVVYTESSLFGVFTLPVIDGTPALNDPNTVVITESMANKYFGKAKVAGQTLTLNDTGFYRITAVIKDVPAQSHFNYDFFFSYASIPEYSRGGWAYGGVHNYVLLKPGTDTKKLEAGLQALAYKNYPASMHTDGNYLRYSLTPVTDIRLRSETEYELGQTGTIKYVYIFSVVAIFILLIACVNFMNLSTARYSSRAKEVGVKKVLGSGRRQLIVQFLGESILVTLIASLLAIVIVILTLPLFNQLAGKDLVLSAATARWLVPALTGIVILVGCLAGAYPAFFLSAFKPTEVLKGRLATGFKGRGLRNALVIFQFCISIFLINATVVIYNQLNYIQKKDLGYNRSQVMVIKNANVLGHQANVLKQQVSQWPGVLNTTMSSFVPTGSERNMTGLFPQLPIDIKQDVLSELWSVDENYMNTMGIRLIGGRNFSSTMPTDSTGLIVNEAFVKRFGFTDALNKIIYRNSFGIEKFHIIGVMKDFHISSLHDNIIPVVLILREDRGAISVRVNAGNAANVIAQLKTAWSKLAPGQQFSYDFMDEEFEALYRSEQRTGQIFTCFSLLAIFIACLGLFGLAAYAAEQRTKEMGIRKVLGASAARIVRILSVDFFRLVLLSVVITSPMAWWFMSHWLQDFAYRTTLHWWVPALAGAAALIIALFTTSFQAIKAAKVNPVINLRSE